LTPPNLTCSSRREWFFYVAWYVVVQAMARVHDGTIPVTTRSLQFEAVNAGAFAVTHGRYPTFASRAHSHMRTVCTVLLEGAWEEVIGSRAQNCEPGMMLVKPAGAVHMDRMAGGTRLIVVEADASALGHLRSRSSILDHPAGVRDASLLGIGWRMAAELETIDLLTPVVVEGLTLELLGCAARVLADGARGHAPIWLARARELIHDSFHEPIRVAEIARLVNIHPVVLARGFRVHLGISPGGYLRRLRLDWAASELKVTERPVSDIALEAGFADQSHFTRAFRRYAGLTPRQYRLSFFTRRRV
jgi:AraC family transcriptional regulator